MNRKIVMAVALVLAMALCLCACGDTSANNTQPAETTAAQETTAPQETTVDDGLVTYTVTVTDAEGNPLAGATVQLCDDHGCSPIPTPTGADGTVSTRIAEGAYSVKFIKLPEGYTYADEAVTAFPLESGSYEITIALAKAQ